MKRMLLHREPNEITEPQGRVLLHSEQIEFESFMRKRQNISGGGKSKSSRKDAPGLLQRSTQPSCSSLHRLIISLRDFVSIDRKIICSEFNYLPAKTNQLMRWRHDADFEEIDEWVRSRNVLLVRYGAEMCKGRKEAVKEQGWWLKEAKIR